MSRRGIVAIVTLGITLAATTAARQGVYEYWKAGTKRGRSTSALPRGRARAAPPRASAQAPPTPAVAPWTEAWFSDSTPTRRRIVEMTEAVAVPMIGQTFPLPRGGGFVCARVENGGAPAEGDLTFAIECAGPELGGTRRNSFYVGGADRAPTLDRVRWVIVAPPSSPPARWRAFVRAVADSLSGVMGAPAWTGPDRTEVAWSGRGYTTTLRLHGTPSQVDSLEIECVSDRLAAVRAAKR